MLLAVMLTIATMAADAGAPPSVQLEGDLIKPVSLTQAAFQALGPSTAEWKDKTGTHQVTGVRLDQILLANGFLEGPSGPGVNAKQKHEGLRAVVIASAPDGFEAVFSVAELLETLGPSKVLLVWQVDGKPLEPKVGPFRLVVLSDKMPTRSLYQLTSLKVVDLKRRATAAP